MNADALRGVLSSLLEEGVEHDRLDDGEVLVDPTPPQMSRLVDALAADEDLKMFDNAWLPSGSTVQLRDVGAWLLARAIQKGVDEAVGCAQRFFESGTIPAEEVVALHGFYLPREISLGGSMRLVPFNQLPNSPATEHLNNPPTFYRTFFPDPTVALVRKLEICPRLATSFDGFRIPDGFNLSELCLSLTAFGPMSPVMIGSWRQFPDWIPAVDRSFGFSAGLPEVLACGPGAVIEDPEGLARFATRYMALELDQRRKLHVPLARLNLAQRRSDPVDQALELGIALESLLASDRPGDAPVSYSLRLRGALLAGGSTQERRRRFELLREVYKQRNHAAHGGKLDLSVKVQREVLTLAQLLQQGMKLCGQLIRTVVERGKVPDWEATLLGASLDG